MRTHFTRHRAVRLFGALAVLAASFGVGLDLAGAVHDDGVFELEGDAVDGAAAGDDWENVFDGTDGADAHTGIQLDGGPGGNGRGVTIFTGGGSKDQQDTSAWKCKNGSVPDKDELLHGFAARYTEDIGGTADEETLLYFGADRFDNSGDAQIGFWFLQDEVGCEPNGGGGTSFSGNHQVGDILILSDFTQGGTQPTISVFEWVGSGGSDGSLDLLAGGFDQGSATCGLAADDDFCAIVNDEDGVDAPWAFLNKSGETDFAHGELYEGGINLSSPVFQGLAEECFPTFVVETRSAQSVTATLKDFIAESFEHCEAEVITAPSSASITLGQTITDVATVNGTGGGVPTGDVQFWVCAPTELTAGVCSTGGTDLGTSALSPTDADTATATSATYLPLVTGTHCFRATYLPDAESDYESVTDFASNECFSVTQVQSSVATAQRWLPNDTATVTPSTATGTVTFTLYPGGSCTGTPLYGPVVVNVVNGSASTSNTTVFVTTSSTVSWATTFASDDLGVAGSSGVCETTQLVIDNDGP